MGQELNANDKKECPECGTFMELKTPRYGYAITANFNPSYPYLWHCRNCSYERDNNMWGKPNDAHEVNNMAKQLNQARSAGGMETDRYIARKRLR